MRRKSQDIAKLAQSLALKPPSRSSAVHKAECIYSTDTEKSPDGLYINLKTFEGFGKDMLNYDRAKNGAIYLHVTRVLVPLTPEQAAEAKTTAREDDDTPNGDIEATVYKQKKTCDEQLKYEVFSPALPQTAPLEGLPVDLADVCKAVIDHAGFDFKTDEFVWKDYVVESKYAKHLIQVEAPPTVRYEELVCQRCGALSNIWLNLSDGYVGCGRKNYDSGGCADGAEGAAITHYQETGGVFPLAVKVGTITPTSADVYSYAPDEDTPVLDPYLADHLSHFGVDVKKLKKTEKSTLQLELEKNEQHDWSEMGTGDTEVVYGPGLVGLDNSGNTCYLNSAIQLLVAIPELASFFVTHYASIANNVPEEVKPCEDVLLQFAKIMTALTTDRVINQQLELIRRYKRACEDAGIEYAQPEQYKNFSVKPSMLKYAIGKVNARFATAEQQDADEFLGCFINMLSDMAPEVKRRCSDPLRIKNELFFKMRQSIVCDGLQKITYTDSETQMIRLPLLPFSMRQACLDPAEEIPLGRCFEYWRQGQELEYFSEGKAYPAVIANSLLTLPNYLIAYMERFQIKEDYSVEKITNPVVVPPDGIEIETESDREEAGYTVEYNCSEAKKPKKAVNTELLQSLMAMGFSEKLCRLACEKSGSMNVDSCVNWILSNMDAVSQETAAGEGDASEIAVNSAVLMELGYTLEQANKAAEKFGNDVAAAVDWLATANVESSSSGKHRAVYDLVGIISHLGSNVNTGHYVCHVRKDGQWYTFNDSKVLKCANVPTNHGYIYLLRRRGGSLAGRAPAGG